MKTSLRISAILLGLLGLERVVYADIISVLPGMAQPTPVVSASVGLAILVAATGLYFGFAWARWAGALGAIIIAVQGVAYAAWHIGQGIDPTAIVVGLLEPLVALLIVDRLVRHWPPESRGSRHSHSAAEGDRARHE